MRARVFLRGVPREGRRRVREGGHREGSGAWTLLRRGALESMLLNTKD